MAILSLIANEMESISARIVEIQDANIAVFFIILLLTNLTLFRFLTLLVRSDEQSMQRCNVSFGI